MRKDSMTTCFQWKAAQQTPAAARNSSSSKELQQQQTASKTQPQVGYFKRHAEASKVSLRHLPEIEVAVCADGLKTDWVLASNWRISKASIKNDALFKWN